MRCRACLFYIFSQALIDQLDAMLPSRNVHTVNHARRRLEASILSRVRDFFAASVIISTGNDLKVHAADLGSAVEMGSMVQYNYGGGRYLAPSAWFVRGQTQDLSAPVKFIDKFSSSEVSTVAVFKVPTGKQNMKEYGAIEKVQFDQLLGTDNLLPRAIMKSDMFGARIRFKDYYDYDFASASSKSNDGNDFGGLVNDYDRILLCSFTVRDEQLYVLAVQSTADEWKSHGRALRELRDSFEVEL